MNAQDICIYVSKENLKTKILFKNDLIKNQLLAVHCCVIWNEANNRLTVKLPAELSSHETP